MLVAYKPGKEKEVKNKALYEVIWGVAGIKVQNTYIGKKESHLSQKGPGPFPIIRSWGGER